MVVHSDMIKRVNAVGTLAEGAVDLFRRNGHSTESTRANRPSRFRGYASFGENGESSALLEVVDTPETKARGFMGRRRIPACCGMLFTDLTGGAFWMKGCFVPLDIVFINDSGTVSRIYNMPVDGGVKRYAYSSDEKNAIELPSGFCRNHGIDVGTKCDWRTWK